MERRLFLGRLGATLGLYAVNPTLAERPAIVDADERVIADDQPVFTARDSIVFRNDGNTPLVIAYKSKQPTTHTHRSRAQQILDKQRYQTEAILLPGEELTITAAPMKGLSAP